VNTPPDRGLDRVALRRAFNRASSSYDAVCELQDSVRQELLERLDFFPLAPRRVLDLGAGTGAGTVALKKRFRAATVFAVDLAEHMLARARRRGWPWRRPRAVAASATALPFAAGSFDLVFCSLMLQWCDDPQQVFAEIQRVLKPGGLLQFATFGPQTLDELRAAWSAADATPHVSELPDLPELAAAMSAAGLAEPVLDRELQLRYYPSVAALVAELRGLGAVNAARARRRSLTGRQRATRMQEHYEGRRAAAGLPASYEILFGAAFAGVQPVQAASAEVAIPLTRIGRRGSSSV
jgi:malonyl-CoA O-methyltransferase